jgi:DNA-binding NarL/FixJ family response regulator
VIGTAVLLSTGITILLISFVYILLVRDRNRSKRSDILLKEIRDDAEEIVREINQVTDRNIAILEDMIGRIDSKLEDADKRITLLGKKAENEEREAVTYSHLRKASREQELFDFDKVRSRSGKQEEAKPETGPGTKPSVRGEVLELSRRGFSSQVIARKTGVSLGEVELMIKLGERGQRESGHDNRY